MNGAGVDTAVSLPEGRALAFAEYGDPAGLPLMLFMVCRGRGLPGDSCPARPFPPGGASSPRDVRLR
jgi:hypothetical protein